MIAKAFRFPPNGKARVNENQGNGDGAGTEGFPLPPNGKARVNNDSERVC